MNPAPRSLRARLSLLGAALLTIGLVIGGFVFDRFLESRLLENLDQTLQAQATDRARTADAGADPATLVSTIQRETAIAIFDESGTLLDSRALADPELLADVAPGRATNQILDLDEEHENEIETYKLRVVAAQPGATKVVLVSELEAVTDPLNDTRRLLAIGIPLAALIGGWLFWLLTGRALRPVETLRRDAKSIADGATTGRVRGSSDGDEIGRLATTLNEMLEQLDERAEVLRRFVSDASHEIRSPVANIRARIETTSVDDWGVVKPEIVGEVERIEAIVDDLTYLARSDEGRIESLVERVELDALLFAEAARVQNRGTISVDASAVEPLVVEGDPNQIARLVRNLVDNAEQHADSKIALSVELDTAIERGGPTTRIRIDDDGPGIPPGQRDFVFDRFARLDDSRQRATGGTGLGLAIARDIVERHGGSIAITESPLGGARFEVGLADPT